MISRVVIYARYSSDKQSDHSIDDQFHLCKSYAEKQGWKITNLYSDKAISGATSNRPDYHYLLEDIKHGKFDIVLAESLDRLSRDQEDIHHLFKRLKYHNIELHTVADGLNNSLHVGMKGMIAAQYLEDLAQKTHRGLAGRIRNGKSAGGNSYGYDIVRAIKDDGSITTGERSINPYEAEVVLRIFNDYISGISAKGIAKRLNQEGVPSPRGGQWNASTLLGNKKRGNGILNNELYIGRLVWNRQQFKKDPDSGKRVATPNPKDQWVIQEAPALRLISDVDWQKAKAIQKDKHEVAKRFGKQKPNYFARHPKHLISDQVFCPQCLGKYIGTGGGKLRCGDHVNRGTCNNSFGFALKEIEKPYYKALKSIFYGPSIVRMFEKSLNERIKRSDHLASWQEKQLHGQLQENTKRKANILKALEQGKDSKALLERLNELENEEVELKTKLDADKIEVSVDSLDLDKLFYELIDDLPTILRTRPFAHTAKASLNKALTNRQDWWEHGK